MIRKEMDTGGRTHDPMMFPNCENELIKASATARLEDGLGMELLIQAKNTMKPAVDCVIKKLR
jgi:hypothetical protein